MLQVDGYRPFHLKNKNIRRHQHVFSTHVRKLRNAILFLYISMASFNTFYPFTFYDTLQKKAYKYDWLATKYI